MRTNRRQCKDDESDKIGAGGPAEGGRKEGTKRRLKGNTKLASSCVGSSRQGDDGQRKTGGGTGTAASWATGHRANTKIFFPQRTPCRGGGRIGDASEL